VCLGALVRAKQAGLACPDWPLCHGEVLPDLKLTGVPYELGHRVLAGLVAMLFAAGSLVVLLQPKLWTRSYRLLFSLLFAAALLTVQIVFGALTVLLVHRGEGAPRPEWWPVVVHLLLGNAFAATMVWIGLDLRDLAAGNPRPALPVAAGCKRALAVWTMLGLLQFMLGGAVASHVVGLVCAEFPACNGGVWFPAWTGYVGLQVWHRLAAYALVVAAVILARVTRNDDGLRRYGNTLAGLVIVQAVLGAMNIWSLTHTAVTTAHSGVAALLFTTTSLAWRQVLKRAR
jgi:cytochrome c oxidase assembly protein subunit 15